MGRSGIAGWTDKSWVEGNKHSAEDKQWSAVCRRSLTTLIAVDTQPVMQ
jgi:hypothetical protein